MTVQDGVGVDWLEISLSVDGEMAEAVAEVLSRFAPNGVMTEQGIQHLDDEDAGTPAGPIVVRAYLPADQRVEEVRGADRTGTALSRNDPTSAHAVVSAPG